MKGRLSNPLNLLMFSIALLIVSFTWIDSGRWGQHWVFVGVYVLALLWSVWKLCYVAMLTAAALVWLRIDLAEGVKGTQLQLASVAFAVLFFLMCARYCERCDPDDQNPVGFSSR